MTIDEFIEQWGDDWGATTLPFVKADIGKLIAAERERCDGRTMKNTRPFWSSWTYHDGFWWCCQSPFRRDGWEHHIRAKHPGRLRKIKKWLRCS